MKSSANSASPAGGMRRASRTPKWKRLDPLKRLGGDLAYSCDASIGISAMIRIGPP